MSNPNFNGQLALVVAANLVGAIIALALGVNSGRVVGFLMFTALLSLPCAIAVGIVLGNKLDLPPWARLWLSAAIAAVAAVVIVNASGSPADECRPAGPSMYNDC